MGNGQIEERSERVMRRKEVDGKQMTNKERKKMEMERSRIRRERGWRRRGRKGREEIYLEMEVERGRGTERREEVSKGGRVVGPLSRLYYGHAH